LTELRTAAATVYVTRSCFPPGATSSRDGVRFCIFSRHGTRVELLLYAASDSLEPFQVITLTPEHDRTFFFWHVFVEGLPPRTCYTWRVDGPTDTKQRGRYFNPRNELLDPWARAVTDTLWDQRSAADPQALGR
jgi:isoamylase